MGLSGAKVSLLWRIAAFVALGCASFSALSQTSPAANWPGYRRGPASSVAVRDNYAYVAAQSGGLVVLDLSKPANPQRVGSLQTSGLMSAIALTGKYAIAAAGGSP